MNAGKVVAALSFFALFALVTGVVFSHPRWVGATLLVGIGIVYILSLWEDC